MSRVSKTVAMALVVLASTSACTKDPISISQTNNANFFVEKLFSYDGCTVFRFRDVDVRYFTNCSGSIEWRTTCGKSCTKRVSVDGGGK